MKLAEHYVEIKAKLDKFDSGMSKVQKTMKGLDKRTATMQKQMASKFAPAMKKAHGATTGLNRGLSTMAKRLIAIGVAYFGARAVFRMSKSFLEVASSVEQFRLRLESLLGSQKAAADAMDYFNDIAAKVPFTLQEIIESGTIITAMGADLKKWTPILTDLAAVMGMKLPEAASALGRAYAGGAGAADIFRERGILQIIKDSAKLKHSIDDITKLTLPEFRDMMFEAFTDPTGKMAGASAKLAKTWVGTISMLQDKWFQFRTRVMKAGIFELLKEGLASFDSKLDEFIKTGKLDIWAKDTAIGVIDAFKFILTAFKNIAVGFNALKAGLIKGTETILNVFVKLLEFDVKLRDMTKFLTAPFSQKGWERLKKEQEDLKKRIEFLKEVQKALNEEYDIQVDKIIALTEKYDPWIEKLKEVKKEIEESKGSMEGLGEKTEELAETITTSIANLPKSIIPPAAFTMAKASFDDLEKYIEEWTERYKEKLEEIKRSFAYIFSAMAHAVSNFFTQIGALAATNYQNQINKIDAGYDARKKAIDASTMDDKAKYFATEKLEREMQQKKKAIQKKEFESHKKISFVTAIINIAEAITKALPNLVLAAFAAASGAVQLATISAQTFPSVAKGGWIPRPMPVMAGHGPKGEIISQPAALAKIITQEMPRQMAPSEAIDFPRRPQQINLRVKFDDFHGIKFREQVVKIVVDEADKGMYTVPSKIIR